MEYSLFGKTGAMVSRLGCGCMRLPETEINGKAEVDVEAAVEMLRKAYGYGVNYFDTAYFYHGGRSEVVLGKALEGIREKVFVATKSPGHLVKKAGDYRRLLDEQLKRLNTGYIDFYHFHGISWDGFHKTDENSGWRADALKAKEEGLVRHLSFSFHSKDPGDLKALVELGIFESVLCQYNALDQSNEDGMAFAKEKGLGVTVMGPLGGGRISGLPKTVAEQLGIKVAASAEMGLRFVAANPNIDVILSGMSSTRQLDENVEYVSRLEPLSEAEVEGIGAMVRENKRLSKLYCTGCRYCLPCPHEVNIPHIFQCMNYYKVYDIKEYARREYANTGSVWIPGKKADACTDCGECEKKCPQSINIRDQLKECLDVLG